MDEILATKHTTTAGNFRRREAIDFDQSQPTGKVL